MFLQGLREAIKNGDTHAVKKLLSEVLNAFMKIKICDGIIYCSHVGRV